MVKGNRLRLCFRKQTADIGGVPGDRAVARACYPLLSEVDLNSPWKPESGVDKFQEDCEKKGNDERKRKRMHRKIYVALPGPERQGIR